MIGLDPMVSITESFWNTETTGQSTSVGGGTGIDSEQMRDPATFSVWNFESIWVMDPEDPFFPVLQ